MAESSTTPATPQFAPRFRNDVYPFIHPSKFKASLKGQVTIITGEAPSIN